MNKSSLIISIASLCVAIAALLLVYTTGGRTATGQAWTAENQRELANKLKSAGLARQAAQEYEQYIKERGSSQNSLQACATPSAKCAWKPATMRRPLPGSTAWSLPIRRQSLKAELGSSIINCLERTGRHSAAEYALAKRTSATDNATRSGGTVVAEIGSDKVYLEDINESFDSLPDWMRKQFEGNSQKPNLQKNILPMSFFFAKR